MSFNLTQVSTSQLKQALKIREQIEKLEEQLSNLLQQPARRNPSRKTQQTVSSPETKTKRTMSAKAKKAIAAAQRARWAKVKAEKLK